MFRISLPAMLNKHDSFEFHFLKGVVYVDHFWVRNIRVIHEYGKAEFYVDLQEGYLNTYREFLLNKADFMRAISHFDRHEFSDYDLDIKLREYEKNNSIQESEESKKWRKRRGFY